jgi:hypothetical protein
MISVGPLQNGMSDVEPIRRALNSIGCFDFLQLTIVAD